MKTENSHLINSTVDFLRDKVSKNLNKINENIATVRSLSSDTAMNRSEKADIIRICNNENKTLLAENNELIHLQYSLTHYQQKYGERTHTMHKMNHFSLVDNQEPLQEVVVEITEEECWKKTIQGEIPYDEEHPCFGDDAFFNKLLAHYEINEEYEQCSTLMQMKSVA